jgi:hypothetical protein
MGAATILFGAPNLIRRWERGDRRNITRDFTTASTVGDVLGEVEGALLASPGSFRPLATIRRTDVANNRVHVAQTVM